jgi:hypothetical protein
MIKKSCIYEQRVNFIVEIRFYFGADMVYYVYTYMVYRCMVWYGFIILCFDPNTWGIVMTTTK